MKMPLPVVATQSTATAKNILQGYYSQKERSCQFRTELKRKTAQKNHTSFRAAPRDLELPHQGLPVMADRFPGLYETPCLGSREVVHAHIPDVHANFG